MSRRVWIGCALAALLLGATARGGVVQDLVFETGEETLTVAKTDLDRGESVFAKQCATCHANAEMVAKNKTLDLTDREWKHGRKLSDLERTIREGIPETEMAPMKDKLLPREIRQVARYVLFVAYGEKQPKE